MYKEHYVGLHNAGPILKGFLGIFIVCTKKYRNYFFYFFAKTIIHAKLNRWGRTCAIVRAGGADGCGGGGVCRVFSRRAKALIFSRRDLFDWFINEGFLIDAIISGLFANRVSSGASDRFVRFGVRWDPLTCRRTCPKAFLVAG